MDAIVVHGSQQEPLPRYRRSMRQLSRTRGFGYDPFSDFTDLILSIKQAKGGVGADIIEIVAHGSRTYLQDIGGDDVAPFARVLREDVIGGDGPTTVYLTGCETGLFRGRYCIAEQLALELGDVAVCGAVGLVTEGAAITADAVARTSSGSIRSHPDCWRCFDFSEDAERRARRREVALGALSTIGLAPLHAAIERALREPQAVELPPLLIGPEQRGVVVLEQGPVAYEVLLYGSVLRNSFTRETFAFPEGRALYEATFGPAEDASRER